MGRYERFFNQIAQDLDLTDTEDETIKGSYEAVGNFLSNSIRLKDYSPSVFPQGSFRLGTVVKPLKKGNYDIDLVCELKSSNLTAKEVKRIVGNTFKESGRYSNLLEEGGRCWTLNYEANPPYHIDILPGVSLPNGRVKATNYVNSEYKWLYTNPKGFANWFLSLKRQTLNERFNDSVEPVKDFYGKSVLQRAVQLIKRHRDVYFKDNPDEGPASVIITALTGLSYNNEATIEDIFKNGPIQWISHIGFKDGGLSIKIPSLPDDDYADKWNEKGNTPIFKFLEWHRKLIFDLDELFRASNYNEFLKKAKEMFYEGSVDKVSNNNVKIMDSLKESFSQKHLPVSSNYYHPLFRHAKVLPEGVDYVPSKFINVKIICRVYEDEESAKLFGDNYVWQFNNYSPILKKGQHLAFKAIIHNEDKIGYHVKWQVTNTGEEARLAEGNGLQLRGEFIDVDERDRTEYMHIESTSYSGTHFIQFFVFRTMKFNGKLKENCVKRSNLVTVNIGASE